METVIEKKIKAEKKKVNKIPAYLIKEVMDGIPFYYKGYKDVLNKTKTKEEIMGCSSLQSLIIEYLIMNVCTLLDRKKYRIFTNEIGNHLSHNNNLSYDIAIIEKSVLTPDKISVKYMDVPPKLVVEVDVQIELEGTDFKSIEEFIMVRTDKIFEFGGEKLIWVLSRPKKVIVAVKGQPWKIHNWDEELELMDGVKFNVAEYLKEEGVV